MRPSFAVSTSVRRADPYALLPPRPSGVGSSLLMLEAGSEVIGRATEQARLKAFAEGVSEGPTAMLLAGAAGMGKTTLWRFGIEMARVRGYRVLATRPSVAEARSGFAALRDLLGDVVGDVLDDVPGPQADALRIALLLKRPDGTHLDQSVVAASCVGSTAPWWRSPGRWPPGSDRRRVHRPRGRLDGPPPRDAGDRHRGRPGAARSHPRNPAGRLVRAAAPRGRRRDTHEPPHPRPRGGGRDELEPRLWDALEEEPELVPVLVGRREQGEVGPRSPSELGATPADPRRPTPCRPTPHVRARTARASWLVA
jgi:hypothetical protein